MKFDSLGQIVRGRVDTTRTLTPTKIIALYSAEQKDKLRVRYDIKYDEAMADKKYKANYTQLRIRLKAVGKAPTWSPQEDSFLISNSKYLSDSTIGLALNRPRGNVTERRKALKLDKKNKELLDVIIWNKRESFDEDVQKIELTKLRPEIDDKLYSSTM